MSISRTKNEFPNLRWSKKKKLWKRLMFNNWVFLHKFILIPKEIKTKKIKRNVNVDRNFLDLTLPTLKETPGLRAQAWSGLLELETNITCNIWLVCPMCSKMSGVYIQFASHCCSSHSFLRQQRIEFFFLKKQLYGIIGINLLILNRCCYYRYFERRLKNFRYETTLKFCFFPQLIFW